MAGNNHQSDTGYANSETRKEHFLVQRGDVDNNDAGSEISLLPLYDKSIHDEGLFHNLDRPGGGVPVAEEIMAGRSRVGGRESHRGKSGWNPRGELNFTGRTETTVESWVHEGDLVTTPSLPTRTDIDSKVGGVRGIPGINPPPPPGRTEAAGWRSEELEMREGGEPRRTGLQEWRRMRCRKRRSCWWETGRD